jgi:hypothetical protein
MYYHCNYTNYISTQLNQRIHKNEGHKYLIPSLFQTYIHFFPSNSRCPILINQSLSTKCMNKTLCDFKLKQSNTIAVLPLFRPQLFELLYACSCARAHTFMHMWVPASQIQHTEWTYQISMKLGVCAHFCVRMYVCTCAHARGLHRQV